MIKEIPKTDFASPSTRASAESGTHPVVVPPQKAPRGLRDVSRDTMRDTLPDVGPETDDGFGERDTDIDPLRSMRRMPELEPPEDASLAPEILISEGYGPTPISEAVSPERPVIDIVEGGIPAEITPRRSGSDESGGGSGAPPIGRRSLGQRTADARSELEAAVREDPVRAVGLAAGAGFAAGAALFATPVVRVLASGIFSVALQSDDAKRIYGHIGTAIVERLEGLFPTKTKG